MNTSYSSHNFSSKSASVNSVRSISTLVCGICILNLSMCNYRKKNVIVLLVLYHVIFKECAYTFKRNFLKFLNGMQNITACSRITFFLTFIVLNCRFTTIVPEAGQNTIHLDFKLSFIITDKFNHCIELIQNVCIGAVHQWKDFSVDSGPGFVGSEANIILLLEVTFATAAVDAFSLISMDSTNLN